MNKSDYILNELKELSPPVANIARVNVFKVPDGYFETLSSTILMQVYTTEIEDNGSIKGLTAPEGYFDSLAANIMQRIKNESQLEVFQETKGISELVAGIGNKNIFTVVPGYFESIENELSARLKNEFALSANVVDETYNISELVASIGNKNVLNIPQGYFENLSEDINHQIRPIAKVVNMRTRFNAVKYAAAAVVTGLIGLSLFVMLNKKPGALTVSTETAAVMKKANNIIETNSFDDVMASISDADIVQFLESKGQNVEASLVASLEDDSKLPDPFDYLINENTLDEVLKTIDLNN